MAITTGGTGVGLAIGGVVATHRVAMGVTAGLDASWALGKLYKLNVAAQGSNDVGKNEPEKYNTSGKSGGSNKVVEIPDGFKETKQFGPTFNRQKVYKKGQRYITKNIGNKDGTSHNGGVWKELKQVGRTLKRIGTLDKNLNRIKK